ncbi:MAG TPA: DUF2797 domain-containing protein, partial [Polyangiaceae bacterium]|nr:DUF2797 domain-containing protein [Polyangiaceae bacterium]
MNEVPETDRAVLAGYGCDERGGYLIVDELEEQAWRRQWLRLKSSRFTLQALSGRYCTGRHDLKSGRSQPCPERAELGPPPYEQCNECFRATGFNPAFYNAMSISPEQQRRNREPHVVYLAHFGAGTLKVGMTYERRGIGRLLEQGARAAALLARFPDAYAARELEERVARVLGIPEAIRPARKRHLLGAPFSPEQARLELSN